MPQNGSRPVYPQRLSWAEHQTLAAALLALHQALEGASEVVYSGYGRASEPYRKLQRSLEWLDLARGHLSRAALTEHSDQPTPTLSGLYYPPER